MIMIPVNEVKAYLDRKTQCFGFLSQNLNITEVLQEHVDRK